MCAIPRLTFRRALRFLPFAMGSLYGLAEVLDALLAGHRLARALAGPGVRLRPLPADRQVAPVPRPAVAADVLEPLDVGVLGPPQGPLDQVLPVQDGGQPGDLVVRQFLGPPLRVDAG